MTTLTTDALIRRIADLQDQTGLFPSVRRQPTLGYRRPDTNIFFTALTVFTLQSLRPFLSETARDLVGQIGQRARVAYPPFQNRDGLGTYNFWPTRPSRHFPNGYVFGHFDHFRIPDDIDDTAMVYLTTSPSRDQLHWLKDKLARHANLAQRRIRNTFADCRDLRAYSTWFGKNMGIDFDACALSNMLYCVYHYDLPRNQHDADSLAFLRLVVESGRYLSAPFRCAPHYARPSLIIYHLTRLMAAFGPAELAPVAPRLVTDARLLLAEATNRLEQILLATSLLRLGQQPPAIDLTAIEQNFDSFHFFIAGLLTAYEQPLLHWLANRSIVQMRWQCEAHCWALVAEYRILTSQPGPGCQ